MTRTNCKWLHVLTHILRLTNLTRKLTERTRNKKKMGKREVLLANFKRTARTVLLLRRKEGKRNLAKFNISFFFLSEVRSRARYLNSRNLPFQGRRFAY